MHSFEWCEQRCYCGCRELVPCYRTAVLEVLRYQKDYELVSTGAVEWYRDIAVVPWYRPPCHQLSGESGDSESDTNAKVVSVFI